MVCRLEEIREEENKAPTDVDSGAAALEGSGSPAEGGAVAEEAMAVDNTPNNTPYTPNESSGASYAVVTAGHSAGTTTSTTTAAAMVAAAATTGSPAGREASASMAPDSGSGGKAKANWRTQFGWMTNDKKV